MPATTSITRITTKGPNEAELEAWPVMDPAGLESGAPVQKGILYDEDPAPDYSVGIWECTAFVDRPGPYPVDEFMLLLEGTVEMAMPDGTSVTVHPGEAFVIPKGLECQWKMPGTVRKIFMILDGTEPGTGSDAAQNAGLGRITVPLLGQPVHRDVTPPATLTTREVYFVNHDSRMTVHIDTFHDSLHGPAPQARRHLIHVLSGEVRTDGASDEAFGPGDSLYLMPGSGLSWRVAAGTRLLCASCDLGPAPP